MINDPSLLQRLLHSAFTATLPQTTLDGEKPNLSDEAYEVLNLLVSANQIPDKTAYAQDVFRRHYAVISNSYSRVNMKPVTEDEMLTAYYLATPAAETEDQFWKYLTGRLPKTELANLYEDKVIAAYLQSVNRLAIYQSYVQGEISRQELKDKINLINQERIAGCTQNCLTIFLRVSVFLLVIIGLAAYSRYKPHSE